MADTGWVSPGTVVEDTSVGSASWSDYNNVKADDGSVASISTTSYSGGETYYIKSTNFGFSIPPGSTISGIEARIQRFSDVMNPTVGAKDGNVKIVKSDGSIGTENKAKSDCWDFNDRGSYQTYGGSSDLWSESWSKDDINDSDFGIVLSSSDPDTTSDITAQVDHIQIKVYYSFLTIDYYSESNQDTISVVVDYYANDYYYNSAGQSFTGNGDNINSAYFFLGKNNSPTGNIYAKIYAHSGTFGTSSVPTGSALATSDAVAASSLESSLALTKFTFSGAERIKLTDGTKYVLVLDVYSANCSEINGIFFGWDWSTASHSGNACVADVLNDIGPANWGYFSDYDLCFYVCGINIASVSPVTAAFTIPEVTATATATVEADVSPVTATFTIPDVTATYVQVETASVSPVAATFTIPDVTATYAQVETASASPVVAAFTIPEVTAAYIEVYSASASPVTATFTIPEVTAAYIAIYSASASPVAAAFTIPEVTAYAVVNAGVSPVRLAFSIPSVAATYEMEWGNAIGGNSTWTNDSTTESTWAKDSKPTSSWSSSSKPESTWTKIDKPNSSWT